MAKTIGSFDLASLKVLRDDVTQYFWFEPDSSSAWGSGAHVTLYPESQFTDSTSPNYMKGQNIIMNTDGFSIRNGALPMMVLDNDSLDFNAVDTTLGTYTTMATFGLAGATIGQASGAHIQISSSGLDVNTNASTNIANFGTNGARIGKNDGAHSMIDADGMRIYAGSDGLTELANIGYSNGSPYYSFGRRLTTQSVYSSTRRYLVGDMCLHNDGGGQKLYVCKVDTPFGGEAWNSNHWQDAIGLYSFSENGTAVNIGNAASGFGSHAEGRSTVAVGPNSHTEGRGTIASDQSHAEGYASKALGDCSHAEGWSTNARGSYSHSQNYVTEATKQAQTALGSFNKIDASSTTTHPSGNVDYGQYAVIVGNGTSSVNLSNALAVDWNGAAHLAGSLFTGCNSDSTGGYEFGRKTGNHVVIGGIHVCWGMESISHTGSGYKEVQVTLPYTYASAPSCFTSLGNRPTGGAARTAYATQGTLAGNKIYVGSYATGAVTAYVNWMTIGV